MSSPAANALKRWRESQVLTVQQLAQMVPVARQTWYSWERGATVPPQELMARIVEITGGAVQPNDFYPKALQRMARAA
ncbi:MAG: helix-turn-helix transcriptional regulator [Polymorphobacter sp.]